MPENTANSLILGLMSGTSLDGLDLALCQFSPQAAGYSFRIIKATTIPYKSSWHQQLSQAHTLNALDYFALHTAYGRLVGEEVRNFLKGEAQMPIAIGSHGHTIFHQPSLGFSTQLGCGATIAAQTGITTVNEFRSMDVALGGQGAPLVPVGDALLFSQYDACLNIGGIANISHGAANNRKAYDICVANMLLNYLAEKKGMAYDAGGAGARAGRINQKLLNKLEALGYYKQKGARSLGREWFESQVQPLFEELNWENALATATEHIAIRIAEDINSVSVKNVLVTGGGAHNTYLLERIRAKTKVEIIVPSDEIINFKEALVFAFLAYLRLNHSVNALSSVTGAERDSITGAVHAGLE
jgi:anhydro-N-acetylmuramic acid kinase